MNKYFGHFFAKKIIYRTEYFVCKNCNLIVFSNIMNDGFYISDLNKNLKIPLNSARPYLNISCIEMQIKNLLE